MLEILPEYIKHFESNPASLIAKIFGVFTVRIGDLNTVYFALMENTVQMKNPELLRVKFDLKGSTFGRTTKAVVSRETDLKDLDFQKMLQDPKKK